MLPGVTIAMGGRDWLVPPLTLGQLRRVMPKVRKLTDIGATMSEMQITVLVEIVATAMQRNYPEATPEMVDLTMSVSPIVHYRDRMRRAEVIIWYDSAM